MPKGGVVLGMVVPATSSHFALTLTLIQSSKTHNISTNVINNSRLETTVFTITLLYRNHPRKSHPTLCSYTLNLSFLQHYFIFTINNYLEFRLIFKHFKPYNAY
jgi:hypothetical protein